MNLIGRKYYLNPDSLRFEEAKLQGKKRIIRGVVVTFVVLLVSVSVRVSYEYFHKSPRLVYYEKKNEDLRADYEILSKELQIDEQVLAKLRRKDDRLYRSIFGMNPLPSSIRDAGTGGAVMHPSLQLISDPELIIGVSDQLDQILSKARIQVSSFEDLEEAAKKNQLLLSRKPSIQPISPGDQYWMTSSFGLRPDPFTKRKKFHHGVDLAGQFGLNIYATGDGKVTFAEYNKHGYGKEVEIDHGFGYVTCYAHLQDIHVKKGDFVKRGQVIGELGSTGRSTGPHLHYEVRLFNKAVNPMYYYYDDLSPEEFQMISDRAMAE